MESIMQHYRKDEQPFIERVLEWLREVENSYAPKLTDFLDPREQFIVEALANGTDIKMSLHGAFPNAERKRALLYPDYFQPEETDYEVGVFTVNYASKFLTLKHKDILGSLMALGLERSKFGDIRILEEQVQFAVVAELQDYMRSNFTLIGKAKISITEVANPEELIENGDMWLESLKIVSSMRLDVVVAALLNVSRQKAVNLIRSEKVRVNWTERTEAAFELYESDVLSIRGGGRFKILTIEGRTRKDKVRLLTGKLG